MENILSVPLGLATGWLLRRFSVLPASAAHTLNRIVLYVCLPAVVLRQLHDAPLNKGLMPVSMAWIGFILALVYGRLLQVIFKYDQRTTGTLIMMSGFSNTSFVGFPILVALFGSASLATGILIDQPGSFLAVSTVGFATASIYSTSKVSFKSKLWQIMRLPPVIALIVALVLRPVNYPSWIPQLLDFFGLPMIPIALVSVGLQLRWDARMFRRQIGVLSAGLAYKLIILPAVIFSLWTFAGLGETTDFQITVIEAAMPPMITAGIIAEEMGLDASLTNNMISVGIPLSLLTLYLWSKILHVF